MAKIDLCEKRGVPLMVSKMQTWHENGVISEIKDPDHRMLFFKSENLDNVFRKIEEIIALSIERIVVEAQSRVTREYIEMLIPKAVRKIIYFLKPGAIVQKMAIMARTHGYGNVKIIEAKARRVPFFGPRDDHILMTVKRPYSIFRWTGDNLGGIEAVSGRECTVTKEKIAENASRLEMKIGAHPSELKERLAKRQYVVKPGNFKLERCPACGIPSDVARCRWNIEDGLIIDPDTGRRMAIFGPAGLEAAFDALEDELGTGKENTTHEWNLAPDGDLTITIRA